MPQYSRLLWEKCAAPGNYAYWPRGIRQHRLDSGWQWRYGRRPVRVAYRIRALPSGRKQRALDISG